MSRVRDLRHRAGPRSVTTFRVITKQGKERRRARPLVRAPRADSEAMQSLDPCRCWSPPSSLGVARGGDPAHTASPFTPAPQAAEAAGRRPTAPGRRASVAGGRAGVEAAKAGDCRMLREVGSEMHGQQGALQAVVCGQACVAKEMNSLIGTERSRYESWSCHGHVTSSPMSRIRPGFGPAWANPDSEMCQHSESSASGSSLILPLM